jgi:hypothetical protein
VLVHGTGLHDIAIRSEAKIELMKASKEQRAGMAGAVQSFAAGGFGSLPARMRRIAESSYPSDGARRRVRLSALTPTDASAFGVFCQVRGRATYFITGIDLCDASDMDRRVAWSAAGEEALRVKTWADEEGGSHDTVSATR